jgi:hypothetical protein
MLSAQKLHRPELGEVSYHWAMGKQRAAISIDYAKFSAVQIMLPSPKRQTRPRVLQKHLVISPIPLPFVAAP